MRRLYTLVPELPLATADFRPIPSTLIRKQELFGIDWALMRQAPVLRMVCPFMAGIFVGDRWAEASVLSCLCDVGPVFVLFVLLTCARFIRAFRWRWLYGFLLMCTCFTAGCSARRVEFGPRRALLAQPEIPAKAWVLRLTNTPVCKGDFYAAQARIISLRTDSAWTAHDEAVLLSIPKSKVDSAFRIGSLLLVKARSFLLDPVQGHPADKVYVRRGFT
ncbi:MAG: hypothetical protein ACKORE_07935, partial [Bacteroidota bacterium]